MKKIEIISDPNCKKVQQAVNEFVKDKIIADLQFSTTTDDYSVMVVYTEKIEAVGENEFNSPRKAREKYNLLKNKYLSLSKNSENTLLCLK